MILVYDDYITNGFEFKCKFKLFFIWIVTKIKNLYLIVFNF